MNITWPHGKSFAFSVFDDTDGEVPGNYEKVYDLLGTLGIFTTKSVWPVNGEGQPARGPAGSTCEDREYLSHILELQRAGFEIGYHNSSHSGVTREKIRFALDRFRELFGADPACMSNHQSSPEGLYWGPDRLSQPLQTVYRMRTRKFTGNGQQGHIEGSPYFWGDLCRERIRYVRNFVFDEIDTLKACPLMPYFDSRRPYARAWYSSTNASWAHDFVKCMTEARQDELEASGGACIIYTHFATNFQEGSSLNRQFEAQMRRLATKNGWFVPVSQLLDHIEKQRGLTQLSALQRQRLEWKWFIRKVFVGGTE
jgi:hypothetical protein